MHGVVISGTGLWAALEVATNEELVAPCNVYTQRYSARHAEAIAAGESTALTESSVEFIEKASGICQRYMTDRVGVLDPMRMYPHLTPRPDDALSPQAEIGVAAARDVLVVAGRDAAEVDMLLCATSNFQWSYPALGVGIQNGVDAGGYAFDMNVTCSLVTLGLEWAINAVHSGTARVALVTGPEVTSGHLDWKDRDCHFVFGDVCTTVLVERAEDIHSADVWCVLGTKCAMSFSNNIRNNAGYFSRSKDRNPDDRSQLFRQEDRRVFKKVCPMAAEYIVDHLQQLGYTLADVHRLWLHQASLVMNQLISRCLLRHNASVDETSVTLDEFANTAPAGSIIAFHRHRADLKLGDLDMICSLGAGYSIGSVAMQKQ